MANESIKIKDLPDGTLQVTDVFLKVDTSGQHRKVTGQNIIDTIKAPLVEEVEVMKEAAEAAAASAGNILSDANGLKTEMLAIRDATLQAQNPLGEYNATTNTPTLAATPVAGPNGTYHDITVAGPAAFAGSNFSVGTTLKVGGRLIKKNSTQWFYQEPVDASLSKVIALETKVLSKNLADPTQFVQNKYLSPINGTETADAQYFYTGKIKVTPGQTISVKGNSANGARHYVRYNAAGAVIASGDFNPVITFVVAAGVEFIAFNGYMVDLSSFQVEVAPAPTFFVPYNTAVLVNSVIEAPNVRTDSNNRFASDADKANWNGKLNASEVITELTTGKNKFNLTNVVTGPLNVVGTGNGAFLTIAGWVRTGPVPLKPNTTYTISGLPTRNSKAVRYENSAGTFLSFYLPGDSSNTFFSFTTPADAGSTILTYINLQRDNETVNLNTVQIEEGAVATSYQAYAGVTRLKQANGGIIPIQKINGVTGDAAGDLVLNSTNLGLDAAFNAKLNKAAVVSQVTGKSKNLANPEGFTSGGFLNGANGNFGSNASYGYFAAIPVTPGASYYGVGAIGDGSGNVNNTGMRHVVFLNAAGTFAQAGYSTATRLITIPADTGNAATDVRFIRPSIWVADIPSFQLELGTVGTPYVPYDPGVTSLVSVDGAIIPQNSKDEIVMQSLTLSNADKILIMGCSYEESMYTMGGKSWVNKLALFSDWMIANGGVSGNRMIDIASRLRLNTAVFSVAPLSFNPTYIVLGNNGNEYFPNSGDNLDLYIEQFRIAAEIVESLGAKPIIGTDYHVNGNRFLEAALKRFADQRKYPYIGIGLIGERMITSNVAQSGQSNYPGFWSGSHPGVRTNAHYWQETLYYISQLERPRKTIKIFRPRATGITTGQINSMLNYDSIVHRYERFIELNNGERALNTADSSESWYDRLNEGTTVDPGDENNVITSYTLMTNQNEYARMMGGNNVAFTDWALMELIIDRVRVTGMTVKVKGDAGLSFYLKSNNESSAYESVGRDKELVFQVTEAVYNAFADAVGTKFTSPGVKGATVQFAYSGKLKDFAMGKGWFLCFTADSDVLITDRVANTTVLTRVVAGTTVTTVNQKIHFRYGYTYFLNRNKPKGAFVGLVSGVTYANGEYTIEIPSSPKYFQFDKVKLLAYKSGAFNISNVAATYFGGTPKPQYTKEVSRKPHGGTELITTRGFDSNWTSTGGWTANGNTLDSMPTAVRDYPPYLNRSNHVTLGFDANGFSQKISRTITLPTSTDRQGFQKVAVRVVARMFPNIYNSTQAGSYFSATPTVSKTSVDLGMLCVGMRAPSTSNPASIMRHHVDIGWSEIVFETELAPGDSQLILDIWRDCEVLNQNPTVPMQIYDVSFQLI